MFTCLCAGLSVHICGRETIEWDVLVTEHHHSKKRGTHTKQHTTHKTRTNAFLDDRIPLFLFPRALSKGNYEFSFAYQTHVSLPGAFAMDAAAHRDTVRQNESKKLRNLRASITYTVHAVLDEGRWFRCWNTRARADLVLYERPKTSIVYRDASYGGTYDATSQTVRLLSLVNQGTCEVAAWLALPAYASGETATLQYRISNRSNVDIRVMKVMLFQDVVLRRKAHASKPLTTRVASVTCTGVSAQSNVDSTVTLALVRSADGRELAPSTTGSLIRCSYRLQLQCDIAWSPDVCLDLPIVIASRAATVVVHDVPLATPVPVAVGVPFDLPEDRGNGNDKQTAPLARAVADATVLERAVPLNEATAGSDSSSTAIVTGHAPRHEEGAASPGQPCVSTTLRSSSHESK